MVHNMCFGVYSEQVLHCCLGVWFLKVWKLWKTFKNFHSQPFYYYSQGYKETFGSWNNDLREPMLFTQEKYWELRGQFRFNYGCSASGQKSASIKRLSFWHRRVKTLQNSNMYNNSSAFYIWAFYFGFGTKEPNLAIGVRFFSIIVVQSMRVRQGNLDGHLLSHALIFPMALQHPL